MNKKIRYILENALVSTALVIVKMCSVKMASNCLGGLAKKIGPHLKVSKVADKNLKKVMPQLTELDRRCIIEGMWENLGRTIAEFPHIAAMSNEELSKIVKIEGLEHLEKTQASGKGAFFVSAHIGNWEVLPRALSEAFNKKGVLVYRPANNPYVDKKIRNLRLAYQDKVVPKGKDGALQMLRYLKQGRPIGVLLDQKMNNGIEAKFFGFKAMTAPAVPMIAIRNDYPILPLRVIRHQENPHQFTLKIYPPMQVDKESENAVEKLTQQINDNIEGWIREYPEQWFWVHKRWSWED